MSGAPALQMLIAQHITHTLLYAVKSGEGIFLYAWLAGISRNKCSPWKYLFFMPGELMLCSWIFQPAAIL